MVASEQRSFAFLPSLTALVAILAIAGSAGAEKPADPPAPKPPALPLSLAGVSDEGTFFIYQREARLATITFKWHSDGNYKAKTVLSLAGQTVPIGLNITADKDGRWVKIVTDTPNELATVERTEGVARKTSVSIRDLATLAGTTWSLAVQGSVRQSIAAAPAPYLLRGAASTITAKAFKAKAETITLKRDCGMFDNAGAVLTTQLVQRYNQDKGGKQTFPVFVTSGQMLDVTLERKDPAERSLRGRDVKFSRYLYGLHGIDLTLWIDPAGKLVMADIPVQHAAIVREGYELLMRAPESDPHLSTAKHEVKIERNVAVPMRDGVKLLTDLYRPDGSGKFPVILIRTPYKKDMMEPQAAYYARRGYVVAVQNCRGRFGSPGTWEPFVHEPKDGYDAVEWSATQPWSTGKVGMIGGSYVGWVQWWAASERPPHLATIIPNVSPPDPFFNIPYEYGVFFLMADIWWAEVLDKEATADLSGAKMQELGEKKYAKLLRTLPVIDLDKAVLGKENPYWRKWIEHPVNDSYWEQANFLDRLEFVNTPVFHQSGWFDGDGIGT